MSVPDTAPLLNAENDEDHPQEVAATYGDVRVVLIDSARYCDCRNGRDVLVVASYCGILPARLIAPHRPVGVDRPRRRNRRRRVGDQRAGLLRSARDPCRSSRRCRRRARQRTRHARQRVDLAG